MTWLERRDQWDKDERFWQQVWAQCRPVSILPESTLPQRLLAWHSKYFADLELARKKAA